MLNLLQLLQHCAFRKNKDRTAVTMAWFECWFVKYIPYHVNGLLTYYLPQTKQNKKKGEETVGAISGLHYSDASHLICSLVHSPPTCNFSIRKKNNESQKGIFVKLKYSLIQLVSGTIMLKH